MPTLCSSSSLFAAEDEEDTIAAQEKVEGNVDHAEELDDLAKEGECFYFPFSCLIMEVVPTGVFILFIDLKFSKVFDELRLSLPLFLPFLMWRFILHVWMRLHSFQAALLHP